MKKMPKQTKVKIKEFNKNLGKKLTEMTNA